MKNWKEIQKDPVQDAQDYASKHFNLDREADYPIDFG